MAVPRAEGLSALPVQAVVFDCDGVIADTLHVWDESLTSVAARHGLRLGKGHLADLHGSAVGPASERLARWRGGAVAVDQLAEELDEELFLALGAVTLAPLDGLVELLSEISGALPLAVASNAPRRAVLRVLARLGITAHFAALVSADDVRRPKPAPDPYLAACRALEADPAQCVAIEDSEIGAESADAAGMSVIELATSRRRTSSRRRRPALLRVSSLRDPRLARLVLAAVD